MSSLHDFCNTEWITFKVKFSLLYYDDNNMQSTLCKNV